MSFRIGRALPGDRPDSGEDAEPDDDPGLTATIAASELDLRPFVGGLLILVGGVLGVPVLVMFGVVILVIAWLRWLWAGRALRRLRFERRFEPDRVMCGDEAHLVITVWNRKLLPLSWLRAQEPLPAELQPVGSTEVRVGTVGSRTLVNGWTLGPYERAVRRIGLRTEHRGIYRFATVGLAAGDLLGEAVADEDRHLAATLVVRPRTVPVRRFEAAPRSVRTAARPARPGRGSGPVQRRAAVRAGRSGPAHPLADDRPAGRPAGQAVRSVARPGRRRGARYPDDRRRLGRTA